MSEVLDRTKIYIGGQWVDSDGAGHIEVVDPTTEEVIAKVADGVASDVDRAVAAAHEAFPAWSSLSGSARAAYLEKISSLANERVDALTATVSQDMGMPLSLAKPVQIGMPLKNIAAYAALAGAYDFDDQEIGNALVVREPIGVVGAITPWNYPLHQVVLKVFAALAAGCTVVLKPTEVAPLITYALADIVDEAGLPPGVFNVVSGYGPVVGEAIAAHPDVDMVSFTGSTRAGKRVAVVAAETVKKVALELGGKSANLILDDADLAAAVTEGVGKCFLNSGQTCTALTRMLVPADRLPEAAAIAAEVAKAYTVGVPSEPGSKLGPLVSGTQQKRVLSYIDKGVAEGAELTLDGREHGFSTGYFVGPTVFSNVTEDMTIAKEEIFGPVLSIMGYKDDDDAVRIANNSEYGLSGGVWSGDPARAESVARRIRTGQVYINGGAFNTDAPFGGYKQSGIGREAGVFGLEEFLEIKTILR
ncbi:aldehyde dehydrogenase family protein [Rhodococcus sp. HNM0563]|uniref:aldehyde dehydrogenase family protein n=1 Tax=unclassified Rhodococcus (in: high G+C Gram-positive bacteria) TaxID=192944 RepID=UPI00146D3E94|nr:MULTISPECIES: aldehyde dehydrogenase family protein [unclassified Rhodococcus (in: high G+C Gram-positive bacteria)]MCK0092621.1 aldehyde dehydrogenase family protein [Rhodococcus sp. F64268]NLU64390.1 aldehyde dehydrogenase family protein [Rhodococcus sp. HNM0563]